MKVIYTISLLFWLAFAFCQPEIKFDFTEYDFGNVTEKRNGDFTVKFWFTNVGDKPLTITQARGSGGGEIASWSKEPILPGKKDCINVSYYGRRVGFFNKPITVYSNAKNNNLTVLRIKGRVLLRETTINVDQTTIQLDSVAFGTLDSASFVVTNTGKVPLHFDNLSMFPDPNVDLFSIRLSLYDANGKTKKTTEEPRYGEIVADSGESIHIQLYLRNIYGNIGSIERNLYFTYNSLDTLKTTIKTKYVGNPYKNPVYEANTRFDYMNEKLIRCTIFNSDKTIREITNFQNGHPISTLQYNWPSYGDKVSCIYKDDLMIEKVTEKKD